MEDSTDKIGPHSGTTLRRLKYQKVQTEFQFNKPITSLIVSSVGYFDSGVLRVFGPGLCNN